LGCIEATDIQNNKPDTNVRLLDEVQYQAITKKAHEEQKFLRFMKEQLKGMSQNTKKQGFLIRDNALKKNAVLLCISVLRFS